LIPPTLLQYPDHHYDSQPDTSKPEKRRLITPWQSARERQTIKLGSTRLAQVKKMGNVASTIVDKINSRKMAERIKVQIYFIKMGAMSMSTNSSQFNIHD
jgi:hypothetical protein